MERQEHLLGKKVCSGFCCTKIENFGVKIGKHNILSDVNVHIHCGELTALIGPNGAGKSTLLKALLGEMPHTGELKFLSSTGRHNGHPAFGYVPQTLSLDRSSPANVMDLFLASTTMRPAWFPTARKTKDAVRGYLSRTGAEYLVDRRLGALSGGELQRVLLAMALHPMPDLLLLDEPVSGVDQNGMKAFYEQVSALRAVYDISSIIVTHDLDLIPAYADRVILLNGTVLASGTPDDVFASSAFRTAFPGHQPILTQTTKSNALELLGELNVSYTQDNMNMPISKGDEEATFTNDRLVTACEDQKQTRRLKYNIEQLKEMSQTSAKPAKNQISKTEVRHTKQKNMANIRLGKAKSKTDVSRIKPDNRTIVSHIKTNNRTDVSSIKPDNKTIVSSVKTNNRTAVSSTKTNNRTDVSSVKSDNRTDISSIKTNNKTDLKRTKRGKGKPQ